MKIPAIFLLFVSVLIFQNCNKSTTSSTLPQLSLQLEYLATTEAELKLTLNSPVLPHDFQLLRDNTLIMAGSMKTSDTTLCDTLLLPGSNYTYQAVVQQSNGVTVQSPELSLTTMDTTNHDFSWEIFTIGNSPIENELFDVSIISHNDIWVVGDIFVYTQFNPLVSEYYNAVHWNGSEWEYHQIYLKDYQGNDVLAFLYAIFSFGPDDIWVFGYAGSYGHWNGSGWESEFIWEMYGDARKIWGTDNRNLYFAGAKGNISHFNGEDWVNMNSHTSLMLRDIHGYQDSGSGDYLALACGFELGYPEGIILMKAEDEWLILDDGNQGPISKLDNNNFASLWVSGRNNFYVTAFNKIYKVKILDENALRVKNIFSTDRGIYRIRGDAENNMFVVGERVKLRHFNGYSWRYYQELDNIVIAMHGLDVKGNVVVAAGGDKIIMGKR